MGNTGSVNTGGFQLTTTATAVWRSGAGAWRSSTLTIPLLAPGASAASGSVGPITIPSITIPEIGLGINGSRALVDVNVPPITFIHHQFRCEVVQVIGETDQYSSVLFPAIGLGVK